MGVKEAIAFIKDATEQDKSSIKKKSLKKVLEKLEHHKVKLEEEIKAEKNDKKKDKLKAKLKLNEAHTKKGKKLLAKMS